MFRFFGRQSLLAPTPPLRFKHFISSNPPFSPRTTALVHAKTQFSVSFRQGKSFSEFIQQRYSDHAPFILEYAFDPQKKILLPYQPHNRHLKKISALVWNIMMQGRHNKIKNRYNNAYQLEESNEQYLARIADIAKQIAQFIQSHPHIGIICLQEAPAPILCRKTNVLNDHFVNHLNEQLQMALPHHFDLEFDATEWGIYTAINKRQFPLAFVKELSVYTNDMNTRKTTLVLPNLHSRIINLHMPHDEPTQHLDLLVRHIIHNIGQNMKKGISHCSNLIIGDMNMEAETFHRTLLPHLEKSLSSIASYVHVEYNVNERGHLKSNQQFKSVDAGITVETQIAPSLMERAYRQLEMEQATEPRARL